MLARTARPRPETVGRRGPGFGSHPRRAPCYSVAVGTKRNDPREKKHEGEKRFDRTVSRALARYLDITRPGTIPGVGESRCKVSSSGTSTVSDRPRIRGHEGCSRAFVPSLLSGPWLPS